MTRSERLPTWPAWWMTIKVCFAQQAAYKANFALLVIGPAIIFWLIKFNLWTSIFTQTGLERIQSYSLREMLSYQSWVLIVGLIGQGHNGMALAEDIRMGKISTFLIYPFDFWKYHTAQFISFLIIQLGVSAVCLAVIVSADIASIPSTKAFVGGLFATLVVSFLWYVIQFAIGLLAFWLDESWIIRVMFTMIAQFCSGALIPLDAYPSWLQHVLAWSPFPLLTFIPVQLFMGRTELSLSLLANLLGWLLALAWITRWIWRRGLRLYSAAGM